MSNSQYRIEVVPTTKGDLLRFFYRENRLESSGLSVFQCIGYLYRWLDAHVELDPKYIPGAIRVFVAEIERIGWSECASSHLLLAASWESRMSIAWSLASKKDQAAAIHLDYSTHQNYWPSVDFRSTDWEAKAADWIRNFEEITPPKFTITKYMLRSYPPCEFHAHQCI